MLRTTFPPFLTDDNLQLHEQDFREPRLVVLLRDRLSFSACPDVLISSAPCDSRPWERMGKTHISCQIYSGTQIILALQNKTQEPNLICLQHPESRTRPTVVPVPKICWSPGARAARTRRLFSFQVRKQEQRTPISGDACRQVVGFCSRRSLFVCGNHLACRIGAVCC